MGRHSFVFMRHVSLLNGIAFQVGRTFCGRRKRSLVCVMYCILAP